MKEKIVALAYDFDKTLSPQDMQNYGFIPGIGMEAENFWSLCTKTVKQNKMDMILGYMMVMLMEAEGKMLLTKDVFKKMGEKVSVFPGVTCPPKVAPVSKLVINWYTDFERMGKLWQGKTIRWSRSS